MIINLKKCEGCSGLYKEDKLNSLKLRNGSRELTLCDQCYSNFKIIDEAIRDGKLDIGKEED